jgi:hypothetical protein
MSSGRCPPDGQRLIGPKWCKKNFEDITPTLPSPLRGGRCEKIGRRVKKVLDIAI